jgi:hypothetical protein
LTDLTTPEKTIIVRRQWNDWKKGEFRFADLSGFHWSDMSGGVGAIAPRGFLHAYVLCTDMLDGELAHSCRHGPPPHRIKVCIVKKDNSKETYADAIATTEPH